ncbi:hypothetical protein B0H14DRAFT_2964494 [Mycena olivaceomarginata]|nr:hypothetical protein B0H14DRAFT_2964494 [Mycena olivaceomarginata]
MNSFVLWWCTRGRVGASGVGRRQWLASGYRQAVSTDLRKLLTNRTKHPTTCAQPKKCDVLVAHGTRKPTKQLSKPTA